MDSLGQYVFMSLLKVLTAFTGDYYRTISESFRGIFMALVVLYVIGIGYAALMNALAEKTKAAVISVFVVLICYSLVFDMNLFSEWVYMPLRKASLGLTSLVLSPSGSGEIKDIFSAIDGSFIKIFALSDKYTDAAGGVLSVRGIQVLLVTLALTLLFAVLYAVFVGLLLIGMFSFHVMMVAAGPVILLAGFPSTRHVFWAWLRACFNYALIPVFTALVMAITLYALEDAAANLEQLKPNESIFNRQIGTVFLIGIISIWFHLKAPEFAAMLTGGTSTGSGFFSTLGAVAGAGAGGAAASGRGAAAAASSKWGKAAGGYAGQSMARAYSQLRGFLK